MLFAEPPFLKFERIFFCHKFINRWKQSMADGDAKLIVTLDSPVVHVKHRQVAQFAMSRKNQERVSIHKRK